MAPTRFSPEHMHPEHSICRISWDELAALHGNDAYYDVDALVAGAGLLIEEEEVALIDVVGRDLAGLRVLHLQFHLGFYAIPFAGRGAHVTGVDFSSVGLDGAERLPAQCGVQICWVCADATELPNVLIQEYDLVWATMGVLCWIADLRAWVQGVAAVLVTGGRLVLVDGWPGDDPGENGEAGALRFDGIPARRFLARGWDYATPARTAPQVQFRHSLWAIVSAAREAGTVSGAAPRWLIHPCIFGALRFHEEADRRPR